MTAKPTRILVIEDESAHAEAISRSLEILEGLELRVMTSLREFREQGSAWNPDLALMDLNLPDGRAVEVLTDPSDSRPFPVVVMTSYGSEQSAVEAMKWGALDYLVKSPDTFRGLPQTLERLLREWQLHSEAKRMQQELKTSEESYRRQFSDNASIMLMIDPADGRIIDANAAAARFYGHPRERLLAMRISEINTLPAASIQQAMTSAIAQHGARFEFQHRLADGSLRNVEVASSSIHIGERNLLHSIVHDITDRKRAEELVEKRILALTQPMEDGPVAFEALFNLEEIQRIQDEFAAATGVASIITHPDGTPLTRPSRFTHLCSEIIRKTEQGCSNCFRSDAAIGRFHPDGPIVQPCLSGGLWDAGASITVGGHHIANWLIGQVRNESQTEDHMRAYARTIGADETTFLQAFYAVPAMSQERFEQIARALFTLSRQLSTTAYQNIQQARFISERKRVEEALKESEENFRSLAESSTDYIMRYDRQYRHTYMNPAGLKVAGLAAADLIGKTHRESGFPEHLCRLWEERIESVFETAQASHLEFEWTGAAGPAVLDLLFTPEFDAAGRVHSVLGVSRDITERKRAEEERRRLAERMSQVQKLEALGVLVAGVAHNINNALAAIMATASLRERLATETKDLEAYRLIGTACKRGRDVVKSLSQFANPSLTHQGPLELHALITEVRVLLESTTRNRIRILAAFAGEPLWINGDAGSLNHALMNLCLNALDAMPEGGTLTFRTTLSDRDWVEVSVEDSGEGMPPEILARVTEPFFTTKEVGKGTGLGLSMTHGAIKAHGGTLELTSVPGQGTTVKIRLPRIPAPTVMPPLEAPVSALGPLTVLLVDDDEDVRFLVARMLKNAGLQVKSAAGGEEALEGLRAGALPDLIILDQNMPRMNGIQTMERIRARHGEVPILISSGQPDIEEWSCFKQPNVAVISKPFEMEELLAKLAQFASIQP